MKLIFGLVILSVFISCDNMSPETTRMTASASSGNAPSKWKSLALFPLQIEISEDFDSNEITAIKSTIENWNEVDQNHKLFNSAQSAISEKSNLNSYEDNKIGIYKVMNWPNDLPTTALAITQIFGVRKNSGTSKEYILIEHADVLVNYDYFTFKTAEDWGYDLETVILHELGHLIGLYHENSSSEDSVMYPTISRYTENKHPLEVDIYNVKTKYRISSSANGNRLPMENIDYPDIPPVKVILRHEILKSGKENFKIIER